MNYLNSYNPIEMNYFNSDDPTSCRMLETLPAVGVRDRFLLIKSLVWQPACRMHGRLLRTKSWITGLASVLVPCPVDDTLWTSLS